MSRSGPLLLMVLLALVAGGAFNYHRNAHLDKEMDFRPYGGITDEELGVLESAYAEEVERLRERLDRFADPSRVGNTNSTLIGERVKAFETSQRANERWKSAHRESLEKEVTLGQIRDEIRFRASGADTRFGRILRRVTTF